MPAQFNVHNGLVDIMFTWPNMDLARAQEIISSCALYWWRLGYGPTIVVGDDTVQKAWEDLTSQEKLDIVYRAAQRMILAEAKSALVDTDTETARESAIEYADGNYILME